MSHSEGPDLPEGPIEVIVDKVSEVLTTIPAPVRKNFWKAFGQLCTAAVEVPVAILEGKAAEKRAESKGRERIIQESARQIATQLSVPEEYVEVASRKFSQKVVREQINLDKATKAALLELRQREADASVEGAGTITPEPPEIGDDWLNAFENEARQKSTEEMQLLFGKILAGEIARPESFSLRTLRLLGQLDSQIAQLFKVLCSASVSIITPDGITHDSRVPCLEGSAASNSLKSFGLSFANLNLLHEAGLITPDYNSYMDYSTAIVRNNSIQLPLTYQNAQWALMSIGPPAPNSLRVHGVALSKSGAELRRIVDVQTNSAYDRALKEFMRAKGFEMQQVNLRQP